MNLPRIPLARELALCARAADSGNQIPILKTTRLVAKDGWLEIANTDLEIYISSRMECDGELSACVDAERLLKYANGVTGECIKADVDDTHLNLRSPSGRARIALISGDYPSVPPIGNVQECSILAKDLMALLGEVTYCIGKREAQYSVHSAQFERGEKGWTMTALDGYRLAQASIGAAGHHARFTVPRRMCEEAQKVFSDTEGDLTLTVDDNYIHIAGGERRMSARRIVERFPDCSRFLVNSDPETTVEFDREALKRSVALACGFAEQAEIGLNISLIASAGALTVKAMTGKYGNAEAEYEETLSAEVSGSGGFEKVFAASAVIQALDHMGSERARLLAWDKKPIHLIPIDGTSAVHIVQPRTV